MTVAVTLIVTALLISQGADLDDTTLQEDPPITPPEEQQFNGNVNLDYTLGPLVIEQNNLNCTKAKPGLSVDIILCDDLQINIKRFDASLASDKINALHLENEILGTENTGLKNEIIDLENQLAQSGGSPEDTTELENTITALELYIDDLREENTIVKQHNQDLQMELINMNNDIQDIAGNTMKLLSSVMGDLKQIEWDIDEIKTEIKPVLPER